MRTTVWQRQAKIDCVLWDFSLQDGRLDLWRNSVAIITACGGKTFVWADDPWPDEIVAAWQEMVDVMQREAGQ